MHGYISMDMILHIVFSLALSLSPSFAIEVSKACYGIPGECTMHNLRCSNGQIAIREAFYTDSPVCSVYGVTVCANVSLSSIKLTGTRYNFNDKELSSLNRDCSTKSTCSHRAGRRKVKSFSAITYQCINATRLQSTRTTTKTATEMETTFTSWTPSKLPSAFPSDRTNVTKIVTDPEPNTGTVVGIVIPIIIIIAGVVTAVIIFRRWKVRQKGGNGNFAKNNSKQKEVHSVKNKLSPDYNYAMTNGHCETSAGPFKGNNQNEEVYSYNHLNEKASGNPDVDSTYNTTASTREKLDASSNDMEDHYGYNHLGTEPKKNLPQSEYDTTASAIIDVARKNGGMEDSTYDHAHLIFSDCSSFGMANAGFQESEYDHASPRIPPTKMIVNPSPHGSPQEDGGTDVFMLAQEVEANPYQLAK